MRRYQYLGVQGGMCCKISSLAGFETLSAHRQEVDPSDFHYDGSTNWNGCDTIERTCKIESFKPTGRKIILPKPMIFTGTNEDWGHSYRWSFEVSEIWEVM